MKPWAESLPHKIPFRAASDARIIDEKTIEGVFLCSAGDALTGGLPLESMLVEAMAQVAGTLAFEGSSEPGYLSAIDEARIDLPVESGDRLLLTITMDAVFGGISRFRGVASRDGIQVATAKFYLSKAQSA